MNRRRKHPTLPALLLTLAACGGDVEAWERRPGEVPRERLVLITLDTLRNDAFLGDGEQPGALPQLRAWAEGGRVYRAYHSCSSATQPAHASLFTGLHPWQNGVSHNGALLLDRHETLAERLRAAGYRTGAVVASYPLHRTFGYQQGFDVFLDTFNSGAGWDSWVGRDVDARGGFFSTGDFVTDQALELVADLGGERQFLWIHYFDPHWPYGDRLEHFEGAPDNSLMERIWTDPEHADEVLEEVREAYTVDVRAMDGDLRRLLDRLASDGVPTQVVVVADHGESLGEHGSVGHGLRVTPEQIRCPLVIHSPRVSPGLVDAPVGTVDVAATLLSLAGLPAAEGPGLDLSLGDPGPEHPVLGVRPTYAYAVEQRTDRSTHKVTQEDVRFFLVRGERMLTGDASTLTYDDTEEPVPAGALSDQARDLFEALTGELRGGTVKSSPESMRALEALGYGGNH